MAAAKRCMTCGINYPIHFAQCRVDQTHKLQTVSVGADREWEDMVKATRDGLAERESPLIPLVDARVEPAELDGQYWISSHEIIRSGVWRWLRAGDLIQVGQQTFEVVGYANARRAYLVEAFETTLDGHALARLTGKRRPRRVLAANPDPRLVDGAKWQPNVKLARAARESA